MITDKMLERYSQMSPEEKMATLDVILEMDVAPIDMVLAFYLVLKPDRAAVMVTKLQNRIMV